MPRGRVVHPLSYLFAPLTSVDVQGEAYRRGGIGGSLAALFQPNLQNQMRDARDYGELAQTFGAERDAILNAPDERSAGLALSNLSRKMLESGDLHPETRGEWIRSIQQELGAKFGLDFSTQAGAIQSLQRLLIGNDNPAVGIAAAQASGNIAKNFASADASKAQAAERTSDMGLDPVREQELRSRINKNAAQADYYDERYRGGPSGGDPTRVPASSEYNAAVADYRGQVKGLTKALESAGTVDGSRQNPFGARLDALNQRAQQLGMMPNQIVNNNGTLALVPAGQRPAPTQAPTDQPKPSMTLATPGAVQGGAGPGMARGATPLDQSISAAPGGAGGASSMMGGGGGASVAELDAMRQAVEQATQLPPLQTPDESRPQQTATPPAQPTIADLLARSRTPTAPTPATTPSPAPQSDVFSGLPPPSADIQNALGQGANVDLAEVAADYEAQGASPQKAREMARRWYQSLSLQ